MQLLCKKYLYNRLIFLYFIYFNFKMEKKELQIDIFKLIYLKHHIQVLQDSVHIKKIVVFKKSNEKTKTKYNMNMAILDYFD